MIDMEFDRNIELHKNDKITSRNSISNEIKSPKTNIQKINCILRFKGRAWINSGIMKSNAFLELEQNASF